MVFAISARGIIIVHAAGSIHLNLVGYEVLRHYRYHRIGPRLFLSVVRNDFLIVVDHVLKLMSQ